MLSQAKLQFLGQNRNPWIWDSGCALASCRKLQIPPLGVKSLRCHASRNGEDSFETPELGPPAKPKRPMIVAPIVCGCFLLGLVAQRYVAG